jgi:hypothetical protein
MYFNDSGRLAFNLAFTDGSAGIFSGQGPIAGDYDGDGAVDASEYLVWRKIDGTQAGYDAWRANFGGIASGAGANLPNRAVPEQTFGALLLFAAVGLILMVNRIYSRLPGPFGHCKSAS